MTPKREKQLNILATIIAIIITAITLTSCVLLNSIAPLGAFAVVCALTLVTI
jgi:hypothetical protein